MKVFRQFDYFRKSTSPEAIKSTFCGGIVSICCIITLTVLIFNEYMILITPLIKKNSTVAGDPSQHQHIVLNLDMDFPNTPCFLLEFEHRTEVNYVGPSEIQKWLQFRHIDPNGKEIEKSVFNSAPFPEVDKNDAERTVPLIKAFYD